MHQISIKAVKICTHISEAYTVCSNEQILLSNIETVASELHGIKARYIKVMFCGISYHLLIMND